jgi:hypothetical protein
MNFLAPASPSSKCKNVALSSVTSSFSSSMSSSGLVNCWSNTWSTTWTTQTPTALTCHMILKPHSESSQTTPIILFTCPKSQRIVILLTWSNGNPHFKNEFLIKIGVNNFQASATKCIADQLHTCNIYGGESFEWTAFYSDTWMHEWLTNLTAVAGWYSKMEQKRLPIFCEMCVLQVKSTLINEKVTFFDLQ